MVQASAVYCPPRHSIAKENFDSLFDALGNRFLAGGDYNAKHTQWGSRLITVRGKNLLNSINTNRLNYLTTYETTYWSIDINKIPDLLDFCITKNISPRYVQINSSAELSSFIYVGLALRLELGLKAWNESLLALDVIIMQ